MDAFTRAATNRSIRTIKTELDFLLDASVLTQAQVSQIAAILPANPSVSAQATPPPAFHQPTPRQPSPVAAPPPPASPINEKAPPAYNAPPAEGVASAEGLYHYQPTDAGDLALSPGERIVVLEWMNADWARGRSERSGQEGIFPRSYVRVMDDAAVKGVGQKFAGLGFGGSNSQQSSYGNAPVEVANGQAQQGEGANKVNAQGKKFGKKLGNAAIFGAGATIGSNIVNGIF